MAARRFRASDLDRWVRDGLISAEQRDALLADLEAHAEPGREISVTALFYYGGGLLVLLAFGAFLGILWQDLSIGGRIATTALSLVFFATASSALLRTERTRLPGELLQLVAIGAVPPLLFALLDGAGWWPEDPGYGIGVDRDAYEHDLAWARMALTAGALAAAAAAFALSRSPFALAAALVATATLAIDASIQVDTTRTEYVWDAPQAVVLAVLGVAYIGAGVALRGRGRSYSIWCYAGGIAALAAGLGSQAFQYESATGWGLLWLTASLAVLAMSIILQERLFAIAGLAGVFVYLFRLVFEVFEDALAPLAFVLLGLALVATGVLYQRYVEPYLARKPET